MTDIPSTRYARTSEGEYLAYQVLGAGPIDVMASGFWGIPIDLMWNDSALGAGLHRIASFSRLITYDSRGFGSSDLIDPDAVPAVQTWMDDLLAVIDAAESEKAFIFSIREAALASMLFAASFPHRVAGLILVDAYARFLRNEECPWGLPPDRLATYVSHIESIWGTGTVSEEVSSTVRSQDAKEWWARIERVSATPRAMAAVCGAFMESDLTQVLPAIQAPTLVIAQEGDLHVRPEHGRYLASHIAGAKLIELTGGVNQFYVGDDVLDEMEEFLTGVRPNPVLDRVLATVMFTDIVGSTEEAARMGDRGWLALLNRYDDLVQHQIDRFRGQHVKGTGDGTLATFDGPARAIECAVRWRRASVCWGSTSDQGCIPAKSRREAPMWLGWPCTLPPA